nr:N-acetylmuramoyl-L-alanine amidase [Oscillospiraceae bacterium]
LLRVNSDNTMTYSYKSTGTSPTPDCTRLPAGTLDYITKTVTYSGIDYYLTNSGKRIRTNAVTVLENQPLGSNPISVAEAGKDGTDTVIKFKTAVKVPFDITYGNLSYTGSDNGYYAVSSFNSSTVTVTFDYITSISAGDISFPESAMFTTGTWSTAKSGELTKTKLTLTLRQSGIYNGITATYDGNGNLELRFNGYRNSINGATIVIDPGHGYTGRSAFDPGAVGHIKEQTATEAISKYVEQMLKDEGANAVRLKTESETYETETRSDVARQYSPDMFIAIHCNSASAENAHGSEAHYFTPFSQPLASYIASEIGGYLSELHGSSSGCDRGSKYNYFWVTLQQDFPSVLVETAFVTNYTEAMALANSSSQQRFAAAIVQGIKRYFSRVSYSCYGDGSAVWTNTGSTAEPVPETPVEEYPPAETQLPTDVETTDPWAETSSTDWYTMSDSNTGDDFWYGLNY